MEKEKLFYSVNDISEVFGIGRNKAYDLVNRADFPKIRLGKKIVVPIDEFKKWVSKNAFKDQTR